MGHYRALTEDEWVRHREIKDHAFYAEDGPSAYDTPANVPETLAERRGLFVDETLVSVCSLYSFSTRLHNEWRPLGGIGGVATPPQHRSQGFARELLTDVLHELVDQDIPYTALWPVSYPYYRSLGWGIAQLETHYEFPPDALSDRASTATGTFHRLCPTDYHHLTPVYEEMAQCSTLAFKRSPEWWRQRVLADAWTYSWTPAGDDDPAGYLVYTVDETADGRSVLEVDELIYRTETARRQLLGFIHRHAPQVDRVRWTCPQESRLLTTVADPSRIDCTIEPGAMVRISDVQTALDAMHPPTDGTHHQIPLRVTDPLLDMNTDTFVLEADEESVTCHREASSTASAIDISTLSQLYVGTRTVDEVVACGDLDVNTSHSESLAALFPPQRGHVTDFF